MTDPTSRSHQSTGQGSPQAPTTDDRQGGFHIHEVTVQVIVMFALLVALVALTGWWDPKFFSAFNLRTVMRDTAIWSLFALGQAVVIITGGIDLSVGSMICFLGIVTLVLLNGVTVPLIQQFIQLPLFASIAVAMVP